MITIESLINQLEAENTLSTNANDPTLQFEAGQELLFSRYLPEQTVESNSFRDWGIKFRTQVANASTRYSPPQKKGNMLVGSVQVELSDSDAATELTMEAYESFLNILQRNDSQQAIATLIRWFETGVSRALAILREVYRVQAIADGVVKRRGANGFTEDVYFPKPSGHRITVPSGTVAAPAGWYNPTYDILADLKAIKLFLIRKGLRIVDIITTEKIVNECLVPNNGIKQYGILTVQAPGGGTAVELQSRPEVQAMLSALAAIGIPAPKTYDLGYTDQLGWQPFMSQRFVIICQTDRELQLELSKDESPLVLVNTLGYTGIGKATGQLTPGVATDIKSYTGKDARLEATGWQTSFPVIQEPEAYAVFTIPDPTP